MKYYTGTGDTGKTQVRCEMVQKDDQQVEAIGAIDELNSFVGLARSSVKDKEVDEILEEVQNKLFTAGAEVGYGKEQKITSDNVKFLEDATDKYSGKIEDIRAFIYPVGSELASRFHVCRSVCRRTERSVWSLSKKEKINPELLRYLNRLSSLFFVLARFANKEAKVKDEVWKI